MDERLRPLNESPNTPTESGAGFSAPDVAAATRSGADASLAGLLTNVFQSWKAAGIPFVVLRNYEHLPATTSNDIDVLVPPRQLRQAAQVMLTAAQAADYRLHNRIDYASVVYFLYNPATLHQVQIDLYPDLPWRGFGTLSAASVLAERIDRGLFAIPHPAYEAAISLLGRLLQHGSVAEKYKATIRNGFNSEPTKAEAVLSGPFGGALAKSVVHNSLGENWSAVERLAPTMRRALVWRGLTRRPCGTVRALLRDAGRLIRRWLRPGGMTLVILGADGSGKSTVGALAIENLRPTFPPGKGLQVHWKPIVFFRQRRQPTGLPNVDPHGQSPRNRVASLCYLGGHWLEFFLGSHLQFRPVLFRGGLVLIDRYYYDFLVDQRRYRLQAPPGLIRVLFSLIRKPDLVFLLDAPADVLQTRKQEVPPAETARQVEAYRGLVAGLPQGRVLDASQPAERVAADLTRHVLDWLSARSRRRGI